MIKTSTLHPTVFTRMLSPAWQAQLQASVRLYLELSTIPNLAQEVDALLQRTEAALLDYLLAGAPATSAERQRAHYLLDMAQHQLLDCELQEQALLGESAR
jgi:hypothetical protein